MHGAWLFPILIITYAVGCSTKSAPPGRERVTLDSGWKFLRADVEAAPSRHFDDSGWETVSIPHCWDTLEQARPAARYYRGPTWYRKSFRVHHTLSDQRTIIRFGAASLSAKVYVNEHFVGEHRGGFAAYAFDITPFVTAGENLLAVRVDNSRADDVPPLSGDFTMFGGLYREVELLTLPGVHISPLDDASPGVYLRQSEVTPESARVEAITLVRNTTNRAQRITAEAQLSDAKGRVVASAAETITVLPETTSPATVRLSIARPRLWNGVHDPYLYRATICLRQDDQVLDELQQPLGLRSFHVDANAGLMLNGKPYPFRGVNVHQEAYRKGWATTAKDLRRDYALIRELGCTGVRLAHYQHPDQAYSICDESGLVVWAELALVNEITATTAFNENAKQQLRELFKQNYNHPSVLFWSLFNEINIASGDPRWNLVRELNELAHQLDSSRPTTGASNLGLDHESILIPDIIAFNRYFGWYAGMPEVFQGELDKIRQQFPGRATGVSEYGAGGSIHQHELLPVKPRPDGPWHPEQWQSIFHEGAWRAQAVRSHLWCNLIWVMFDFSSDGRNEGDTPGINDKGLVSIDRRTCKDAFYFYKANWSSDPFVYIAERRLARRPPGKRAIKVYSNCEVVECFAAGKSLGGRRGEQGVFVWEDVEFTSGETKVEAHAYSEGSRLSDSVTWTISTSATTQQRKQMDRPSQGVEKP